MEIASYLPAGELALTETAEVLESEGCRIFHDWKAFARAAAGSECAIIALKEIRAHEESIRRLRRWWVQRGGARPGVVLIAPDDVEGLCQLAELRIEQVVLRRKVASDLPRAIRRAARPGFFADSAARLRAADHLAPVLEGILVALLAQTPYREVKDLASDLDVTPSVLRHHWRNTAGKDLVSLKGFLNLILLAQIPRSSNRASAESDRATSIPRWLFLRTVRVSSLKFCTGNGRPW